MKDLVQILIEVIVLMTQGPTEVVLEDQGLAEVVNIEIDQSMVQGHVEKVLLEEI